MAKFRGIVWRLAKDNIKLNKELYKDMRNRSPFIKDRYSMKDFKEAFHSPQTKPEHRALMLSSLYDPSRFRDLLYKYNHKIRGVDVGFKLSVKNGSKSFDFVSVRKTGLFNFKSSPVALPDIVKRELKTFYPLADDRNILTKALNSGNVHAQKVALCVEEVSTFLHSLADLVAINIQLNDPKRVYFQKDYPPNEFDDDTISPKPPVGSLQETQAKFLEHITHMRDEFQKYENLLGKLGVETDKLKEQINIVRYNVGQFISTTYNSTDAEAKKLYTCFERSVDMLDIVLDVALSLQNMDLTGPKTYNIYQNEIVPKYQPYSARDFKYVSSSTPGVVGDKISSIIKMLTKKR